MRLRRWFKRTLIVATTLVVILITLNLVFTTIWSRQVDRILAELRAKGEPVVLADLVPEPVPDEQNAALLYHKALSSLNYKDRDNLSTFFSEWTSDRDRSFVKKKIETLARKRETIVSIIREAIDKPQCVPNVRVNESAFAYNRGLGLSSLSLYLASCAAVEIESGAISTAVDDIVLDLQMIGTVDPLYSPLNDRDPIFGVINKILNTESVPSEDIERIHAAFCKLDPIAKATKEIQIRRVMGLIRFRHARRNPGSFVPSCMLRADGCSPTLFDQLYFRSIWCLWRPFAYKDELIYLMQADDLVKRVSLPYQAKGKVQQQYNPVLTFVTNELGGLGGDYTTVGCQQAQIGLAQTALALKVYKNRKGSYPSSLRELETYPGWKLPKDPFSGKPFGYRRMGQGFRVWSWGDDLVDDDGRLDSEIHGPGTGGREDMVWIVDK